MLYFFLLRLIENHYSSLKPLLAADPLLLPILVYICPRKQLPLLVSQIPVYVSAVWLAHLITSSYDFNTSVSIIIHISTHKLLLMYCFRLKIYHI